MGVGMATLDWFWAVLGLDPSLPLPTVTRVWLQTLRDEKDCKSSHRRSPYGGFRASEPRVCGSEEIHRGLMHARARPQLKVNLTRYLGTGRLKVIRSGP